MNYPSKLLVGLLQTLLAPLPLFISPEGFYLSFWSHSLSILLLISSHVQGKWRRWRHSQDSLLRGLPLWSPHSQKRLGFHHLPCRSWVSFSLSSLPFFFFIIKKNHFEGYDILFIVDFFFFFSQSFYLAPKHRFGVEI